MWDEGGMMVIPHPIKNKKVPLIELHARIPGELYEKLEDYCNSYECAKTRGINDLLEIGLIVFTHLNEIKEKLKHPELLEEIHNQLKEGGLVDYAQRMNPKDFNLISSIIETEKKARKI